MDRRDSIVGLLALGIAGTAANAFAQGVRRDRPFRIGFPHVFASDSVRGRFIASMREFGWHEKLEYIIVESTHSYEPARADEGVRKFLAEKPDLILVVSTAYAVAAHRQTKTVPIVMFSSGYPVEAGVANSLARPGRNVTGSTVYAGVGIWGKLLELLRESKPGIKRVGVLWGYTPPAFPVEEIEPCYRELKQGAAVLGLAIDIVAAESLDRVPAALDAIAAVGPDSLLVTTSVWTQQVVNFAIDRKLPTISEYPPLPGDKRPQPLLCYAASLPGLRRVFYTYIDRILKGANPGDLPIQQPSKFDLIVNLRSATAIGLKVPLSLLLRADQVID